LKQPLLGIAAALAALFLSSSGCSSDGDGDATLACRAKPEGCSVGELATALGVFAGASFVQGNSEPEFRAALVREFNSTTAPLYWQSTHPSPDRYDFAIPDEVVELAAREGLRVRGHPLIWGRLGLPDYVRAMTDAAELRAAVHDFLTTVVTRYRGRIRQYDVVNEPITFNGEPGSTDGLDDHVFLRLLGPGYIRAALDLVHQLDPAAELYVNDFGVERPGPKQDRFYELIRELVESGAPLDGVGFQAHILPPFLQSFEPTRAELTAAIERFSALGLDVELTEADVTLRDAGSASELERQRAIYRDLALACFGTRRCRGLTTWGITDKFTWIRDFFAVEGAPLLLDEEYRRKPAYEGVREALEDVLAMR
jgi:endo-1,4-beta-xylanase